MCRAAEARSRPLRRALLALLCVLGPGCAVGPDFVRPPRPFASAYSALALPPQTVLARGRAQRFEPGVAIAADWWELFRSPELEARIDQAMSASPNLGAARASLRQSIDTLRASYGVFFPAIDGEGRGFWQRGQGGNVITATGEEEGGPVVLDRQGGTFHTYTWSGTVLYTLDLFGGSRRSVEAQRAEVDRQAYETAATYLTLVGNLVSASIAEANYSAQIAATQRLIAEQREQLALTRVQVQAGSVPYTSELALAAQLGATEATLPPLESLYAQAQHSLAVLSGVEPAQWNSPAIPLESFELPESLPVVLPSELAQQRPDILAAEAAVHAASAEIGVATAALFPQLTMSADGGGFRTESIGATPFWIIDTRVTAPFFHGGTLWFTRKAAIATHRQSLAQYRQTVLGALAQVADALQALHSDAARLAALQRQESAARDGAQLTRVNYRSGLASYLEVLTAQAQEQQATLDRIGAQAQRLQDSVALFVALGGGWWNAADRILHD